MARGLRLELVAARHGACAQHFLINVLGRSGCGCAGVRAVKNGPSLATVEATTAAHTLAIVPGPRFDRNPVQPRDDPTLSFVFDRVHKRGDETRRRDWRTRRERVPEITVKIVFARRESNLVRNPSIVSIKIRRVEAPISQLSRRKWQQ